MKNLSDKKFNNIMNFINTMRLYKRCCPALLPCLLTALLLCSTASFSLATTYTANPTETTNGKSMWGDNLLRFEVSIDGSDATFTFSRANGSTIPSVGSMYLQTGSNDTSGNRLLTKQVDEDSYSGIFSFELSSISQASYPQDFYIRYDTGIGGWAWAGPITISSAPPVSGSITSPQDGATLQGVFTVSCNANAPAGLKEVSLFLGTDNYDSPIELCKDGTASSCSGTSKSWNDYNIDPTQYGVTSSDTFKLILVVRDEDSNLDYVDYHEVTWSPETPPSSGSTGSITSPGSSATGNFTVSCNANDPAGLEKVSVVFSSGDTLILCEDGTGTSCSGNSDSWSESITPADY
ncbi:MAG: hypothetical protein D3904_04920, partial [Candidatus Electrothrix sp. EH2]|nr:hypothetical protein [Candidatus Electrothrix sp. EH2]